MGVEGFTRIGDIFPGIASEGGDGNPGHVSDSWQENLNRIIGLLSDDEVIDAGVADQLLEGVIVWRDHRDHVAEHSFHVYQGMRWLAERDGRLGEVSDSMLQAEAVLHDLAQSMPLVDLVSGEEIVGNVKKRHAQSMSMAVKYIGKAMGINETEVEELSRSVRVHDDVYAGRVHENLPYSAQLLSDSDKLFGSSLSREAGEIARGIARRNMATFATESSWYTARELPADVRDEWQYGDRWLSDKLSAVRQDVFGLRCYTDAGRSVSNQIRGAFLDQVDDVYGEFFDATVADIVWWQENRSDVSLELVAREQENVLLDNEGSSEVVVVNNTYNLPLEMSDNYLRGDFEPRGWNIRTTLGEDVRIIDPSVARFAFDNDGNVDSDGGRLIFINFIKEAMEGVEER